MDATSKSPIMSLESDNDSASDSDSDDDHYYVIVLLSILQNIALKYNLLAFKLGFLHFLPLLNYF